MPAVRVLLLIGAVQCAVVHAQTLSSGTRIAGSTAHALTPADRWGAIAAARARVDDTNSQTLPLAYVPALYTLQPSITGGDTRTFSGTSDECAIACAQDANCAGYRVTTALPPDCALYSTGNTLYSMSAYSKCVFACEASIDFVFEYTNAGLVNLNLSTYVVHMSAADAVLTGMTVTDIDGRVVYARITDNGARADATGMAAAPHYASVNVSTRGVNPRVFPPIAQTMLTPRSDQLHGDIDAGAAALIAIAGVLFCAGVVWFVLRLRRRAKDK